MRRKTLAAAAVTLLAALALAMPAGAMLPEPESVRPGKNITVFPNGDFVAVFGHPVGQKLTVDVYRGPHKIATAFGPAVDTPEGGGLEINHGPAGAAVQGDCWEGHTPDILPGDRVVVTDSTGGTDQILVDDIAITNGPFDNTASPDQWDVIVEGHASRADGTPIPLSELSSEVRQDVPRYLAAPNKIERVGTNGWRATYTYPYRIIKNREGLDASKQKQAILTGNHEFGYGHVAPLPPETQLAESGATGGPALDCGNPSSPHYAPKQANAITTSDDSAVNLESGSLNLSGTAMANVNAVSVTLSDSDAVTDDVAVNTNELTGDSGEKAWSVEFTREQVESLADGALRASGSYTLPDGSTTGASKNFEKDLIAPQLSASPGPRTFNSPAAIALRVSGGGKIRYTTDGSRPNNASKTYRGTPIELTRTATIRAFATDAAGNRTDKSFRYVVRQPSSVSLQLSDTSINTGQRERISGTVRPAHPGSTVTLEIKRGGRVVLTTERRLSSSSAYSFTYTPRRAGTYSVKASFVRDADHLGDSSQIKRFTVR